MLKLMNSAMMPNVGTYKLKSITKDAFIAVLQSTTEIESSIGYQATADFISKISGVNIPVNRNQTIVENGDTLLICKLKYRVQNPSDKGVFVPTDDDYEFFICYYSNE